MKRQLFRETNNPRGRGDEDYSGQVVGRDQIPGANAGSDGNYSPPRGSDAGSSAAKAFFIHPEGSTYWGDASGDTDHAGYFSPDNPYAGQLVASKDASDTDALFERAIEWEADRFNQLEQRAYAEQVLNEQRAYDDPSAQVARQRAAGINPDLVGGSGGGGVSSGSSAQMNQPAIADQTGLTKFGNYYDDEALELQKKNFVLQAFQTGISAFSAIGNFGSQAVNSICQVKQLPSQIELSNSQASLASASANATNALLPGQKSSQFLSNIKSALSVYKDAQSLISPDMDQETAYQIFSSAGIPQEQHEQLFNGIRASYENPAIRAYWEKSERDAIEAEEYNNTFNREAVSGIIEVGKEIQDATLSFDRDLAVLKNDILKLVDVQEYASDTAGVVQMQPKLNSEKFKLQYEQTKRDVTAFVDNVYQIDNGIKKSQEFIDKIKSDATNRAGKDIFGNQKPVKLSGAEKALIEVEEQRILQYHALGSASLSQLYSLMNATSANMYYRDANLDPGGNVEPAIGIKKHDHFMRVAFSSVVIGDVSKQDLTDNLIKHIPVVGDIYELTNLE